MTLIREESPRAGRTIGKGSSLLSSPETDFEKENEIWVGAFHVGAVKTVTNCGDEGCGDWGSEPDCGAKLGRIMKPELEIGMARFDGSDQIQPARGDEEPFSHRPADLRKWAALAVR